MKTLHSSISTIKISHGKIKDLNDILNLLYELERPKPKNPNEELLFKKLISKYICDKDKQILIAEDKTKIVGMVSIVFLTRLNRKRNEMYIPELIISKDSRGIGVGKAIMNKCIEIGKKKKCFRLRLESGNQRKDAHDFYKKIGFEQSALTFTKIIP